MKPHVVEAEQLLANEKSRKLLLAISRRFEDTGRGRMSTRRTETAKVVHGPAWQSFVIDSLRVEDSRQTHIKKMARLSKDMTSASNMQVHTRVSKLLRAEECDDEDMVGQDGDDESDTEKESQDIYGLSDRDDMAAQDPDILKGTEDVANKPSNVQKRPAGPRTHLERKMATPPKTPAAMQVPRSTRTQIINGQIVVVPKKKTAKGPRALSKSPAKGVAKPAACSPSKASTQNSKSYTETRVHANGDKENEEPRAKRRRMGTGERDQCDGSHSVVDVSSAESTSGTDGSDC